MTATVLAELKANYDKFAASITADTAAVAAALVAEESTLLKSYHQICAFRGFHEVALTDQSEHAIGFFIEAHNDLLTAHALAASGMWRSAHISLRSFMESYMGHLYFQDHPVELELWGAGLMRTEPKDLRAYVGKHPLVSTQKVSKVAAAKIDSQYSRLSKSVHGSKVDFRMTESSKFPAIATADPIKLRKWQTLATDIVRTSLVLYLAVHRRRLTGAAHPSFRKVLGVALTPSTKQSVKAQLGVVLP